MNICFVTKYPPIQGGVSARCHWLARNLARRGHKVVVVTNAQEVEPAYRIRMTDEDREWYEATFPESGGAVIVKATTPPGDQDHHIPFANPFVTKLAAVAKSAIAEHQCSVIFAYYLEPYGVAAHLASKWTGVPYLIRHAGSDLGRLMKNPELRGTYQEVFRQAHVVLSGLTEPLVAMGVDPDRIWSRQRFDLPELFDTAAPPLDLARLASEISAEGRALTVPGNTRPLDPSRPTIGIYGKVGVVKGSLDLLAALSLLKQKGHRFNFVAVTQGRQMDRFVNRLRELELEECTWILPFMPHWRIPSFIRACTAVCFLERQFPIGFHAPGVPREVLACGTCLVVSSEVLSKQLFAKDAHHGENLFEVDPTNHRQLAAALEAIVGDPGRARRIGDAGSALITPVGADARAEHLAQFEQQLRRAADAAAVPARATASTGLTRVEALASCLPLTRTALGERWSEVVGQYCRPERSLTTDYQDAVNCLDFVGAAGVSNAPPWFEDLLRYERAHNRLYAWSDLDDVVKSASNGGRPLEPDPRELQPTDPRFLAITPTVKPGVWIEAFDHDMNALCGALDRSDTASAIERRQTIIVFKPERNLVGQELVINEATRTLIESCDGRRTIRELAAIFAGADDDPDDAYAVASQIARALKQLATKGIVNLPQTGIPEAAALTGDAAEVR